MGLGRQQSIATLLDKVAFLRANPNALVQFIEKCIALHKSGKIGKVAEVPDSWSDLKSLRQDAAMLDQHLILEGPAYPEDKEIFPAAKSRAIFLSPSFNENVTGIGDLHGDIITLIATLLLKAQQTIFFGDYVDSGYFSLEVILILLLLQQEMPTKIILLRGNHETVKQAFHPKPKYQDNLSAQLKSIYASDETGTVTKITIALLELFTLLPFWVYGRQGLYGAHGGVLLRGSVIDDDKKNKRLVELDWKTPSAMFDKHCLRSALWSDPCLDSAANFLHAPNTEEGGRGVGWLFGEQALAFNKAFSNKKLTMLRGHQLVSKYEASFFGGRGYTVCSTGQSVTTGERFRDPELVALQIGGFFLQMTTVDDMQILPLPIATATKLFALYLLLFNLVPPNSELSFTDKLGLQQISPLSESVNEVVMHHNLIELQCSDVFEAITVHDYISYTLAKELPSLQGYMLNNIKLSLDEETVTINGVDASIIEELITKDCEAEEDGTVVYDSDADSVDSICCSDGEDAHDDEAGELATNPSDPDISSLSL